MALAEIYPMIVVSHSPAQAERLADTAVIFESGRVIHRLEKSDINRGLLEDLIDK